MTLLKKILKRQSLTWSSPYTECWLECGHRRILSGAKPHDQVRAKCYYCERDAKEAKEVKV